MVSAHNFQSLFPYSRQPTEEVHIVGSITETPSIGRILWDIPDFFSLPQVVGVYCKCPITRFAGVSWWLKLYPNGELHHPEEDKVGIYVMRATRGSPLRMDLTLGIKAKCGRVKNKLHVVCTFGKHIGWGSATFLKRSELLCHRDELVPTGVLSIICTMRKPSFETAAEETGELSSDLMDLLQSGKTSDVKIQVQNEGFNVHMVVLVARCPVLADMLKRDKSVKNSRVVTIGDCEPQMFKCFLKYLYTGKIAIPPTAEHIFQLYAIADKYQVRQLYSTCIMFLRSVITVENACDVITVGEKYGDTCLMEAVASFFKLKFIDIVLTSEWGLFLRSNPDLANKLLTRIG